LSISARILVGGASAADSAADRQRTDTQADSESARSPQRSPIRSLEALHAFAHIHSRVDIGVNEVDTRIAVELLSRRELDIAQIRQLTARVTATGSSGNPNPTY
jgi:hypothetical protein